MSPRRRTSRREPPRCNYCQARVRWLGKPRTGAWATWDPTPVDSRDTTTGAHPVWGRKAWDVDELTAELQVQRGCSDEDARQEVLDMPWYRLHRCGERIAAHVAAREANRSTIREEQAP